MRRKIYKLLEFISFYLYNRIAQRVLPLDFNKIVFASEARDRIKGNLKAVYDELPEDINKVIHLKSDRRDCVNATKRKELWRDLTTARVIVLDDYFGLVSAMKVREGQDLLQLWHGAGAFKKFGYSRINSGDNVNNIHSGYRKYTKAITTSEPIRECYAEAFGIDISKIWDAGTPRSDMFFDEEKKEAARQRVLKAYPNLKNKKVVLIAPTYRGSKVENADYNFEALHLTEVVKLLGKEYILLLKWHPALISNIKRGLCDYGSIKRAIENNDNIIDASDYSDINDLLIGSDILITDYSSVIFDYYLLNKPIVYYAYDIEEYKSGRGLYYDFEEYVYGKVATNNKELEEAILAEEQCNNLRDTFGKKFMSSCDGHATDRICKWIIGDK